VVVSWPIFDRHILTLEIASFVQALAECRQEVGTALKRLDAQISDHRHCQLLRTRLPRPSNRSTAQNSYEIPTPH
jgi:hypothetical protein